MVCPLLAWKQKTWSVPYYPLLPYYPLSISSASSITASSGQVLSFRKTSTSPAINLTPGCIQIWRERHSVVSMHTIVKIDRDYTIVGTDSYAREIPPLKLACGFTNLIITTNACQISVLGEINSDIGSKTRSSTQPLRRLSARRIILISRNSNSRQNTNNRHNDHQLDQGKALLSLFHLRVHVLLH